MSSLTPAEALERLRDGNRRFLAGEIVTEPTDRERRLELAAGQQPFAAYLSCSDSRVPPELLFGRGLGELFIVRNAGNTLCSTALGSLEFAVSNLGISLIVVMGHEGCGAVRAAVSLVRDHAVQTANINKVLQQIVPAVLCADPWAEDLDDSAARQNVRQVVGELRSQASPAFLEPQRAGTLKVVGAYYHMHTGEVEFLAD